MKSKNSNLTIFPSQLEGEVSISGAKNSVLKLQTATILTDDEVVISNFPHTLSDAIIHTEMLTALGKECTVDNIEQVLTVKGSINTTELNWDGRSIRNTLLMLGALLSKHSEGSVPLPGGCKLGERKYDIHVNIWKAFGAQVTESDTHLIAKIDGNRLKACDFTLPMRSTGATENAIICASLAQGVTNIWNPHIRPEIIDLINMLNTMGAKILVRGQERIIIEGVEKLKGTSYRTIPDNMEALTWTIASAVTGGNIHIKNYPFEHLTVPLEFLRESGCNIYQNKNNAVVTNCTPLPFEISTGPYPGINSDMQPLFAVLAACSYGSSKIVDLRFLGRYAYAEEFSKMGVDCNESELILQINGKGRESLHGANVCASDLRAGIALSLMGMAAKSGVTTIENAWQIERGYCDFYKKLTTLGVKYER